MATATSDVDFVSSVVPAANVTPVSVPDHPPNSAAPTVEPLVALVALLATQDSVDDASRELVRQLQSLSPQASIAVGLVPPNGRRCRLSALTGVQRIDRRTDQTRTVEAAMDEALTREGPTVSPNEGSSGRAALVHDSLLGFFRTPRVVTLPLQLPDGELVGAITLALADSSLDTGEVGLLEKLLPALAGVFHLLGRKRAGRVTRRLRMLPRLKRMLAVLAVCGVLLAGVIPVPHRVACDVELQPVKRRFVAAPHDGRLEKSLREPGDLVATGDLLARMDARELRLQISSLQAQYEQAKKRREASLATGAGVEAQIARLEMRNIESELEMLRQRESSLEIRSPLDGIVVSGDLERVEGAPLSTGQTLFEVAPLDEMIAELRIPEADVAYVDDRALASLRLHAFPGEVLSGAIDRLHPRSELIDNEAVFVAEFRLANDDRQLRPGMSGRAHVACGYRPLAWTLFHKPIEAVAIRFGW